MSPRHAASAVVLFAHGARDPEWARPIEAIRDRMRAVMPPGTVVTAYLEYMQPDLRTAIEALAVKGVERITVMPIFVAQGGHLKRDVPILIEAVRREQPGLAIRLAPVIGDSPAVLDAIAAWCLAEHRVDADAPPPTATA